MQHIKKEVRDLLPFFFLVIVKTQITDDSPGVECLDKLGLTLNQTHTQPNSHSHRHSPLTLPQALTSFTLQNRTRHSLVPSG